MIEVTLSNSSGQYVMKALQTDAAITSGNSGGPLCNANGEVIGITSLKLSGQQSGQASIEGMGFAIPIDSVTSIITNIENGTAIERPYIGVQLVDLTNTFALQYYYNIRIGNDVEFGAVLSYIEEGKSASKAGLKVGDVVIELDGQKVEDVSHFKYLLYKHKIGDKIKIKYYRENKINETNFKIRELENHIKIDKTERNKENNYKEFEKEYNYIIDQLVIVNGEINHPLTDSLINDFIDKYGIKPQNDILNKLQDEFINRAYEKNKDTLYKVKDFILYNPL